MLLAIEVGNSNTLFGLYSPDDGPLVAKFRLTTERDRMPDEWFALISILFHQQGQPLTHVDRIVISSVVPPVTTWLTTMSRDRFRLEPLVIGPHLDLGIRLLVDEPDKVGADRIVDCIAAHRRYGGPAIIIDLGTATTIDAMSADGDYLGGVIAPGVSTSLRALAGNAAQLFSVELFLPDDPIGKNTADQVRSGVVLAHQLMMEGMIERFRQRLGPDAPSILTGGLAPLFAGSSPAFTIHDPDLTVDGMRMIALEHPDAFSVARTREL